MEVGFLIIRVLIIPTRHLPTCPQPALHIAHAGNYHTLTQCFDGREEPQRPALGVNIAKCDVTHQYWDHHVPDVDKTVVRSVYCVQRTLGSELPQSTVSYLIWLFLVLITDHIAQCTLHPLCGNLRRRAINPTAKFPVDQVTINVRTTMFLSHDLHIITLHIRIIDLLISFSYSRWPLTMPHSWNLRAASPCLAPLPWRSLFDNFSSECTHWCR